MDAETLQLIRTIIAMVFLNSGALFMMLAGLGLKEMPDLFTRMHAATKAASFGAAQILLAVAITFGSFWVIVKCLLIVLFVYLTAPVAAHMLGRASYFLRQPACKETCVDELAGHYNPVDHSLGSADDTDKPA